MAASSQETGTSACEIHPTPYLLRESRGIVDEGVALAQSAKECPEGREAAETALSWPGVAVSACGWVAACQQQGLCKQSSPAPALVPLPHESVSLTRCLFRLGDR